MQGGKSAAEAHHNLLRLVPRACMLRAGLAGKGSSHTRCQSCKAPARAGGKGSSRAAAVPAG